VRDTGQFDREAVGANATVMNTNLRNALQRTILAGLCALAAAAPGLAQADAIAGLFATGAGGTPGHPDLNYTLVQAPAGVSLNTVIPSVIPSSWYVPPGASWLGLADNVNQSFPRGDYTFQLTFDLLDSSGDALNPATATITGLFASDDLCTVYFNGHRVAHSHNYPQGNDFSSLNNLDITSGFVEGANTLDFVVKHNGQEDNPVALLVSDFNSCATTLQPVPEPGDLVVLGIGLGLLVLYYRFRRPAKMVIPIKLDPSTARRFHDNRRH
jgi:hypothetical protein